MPLRKHLFDTEETALPQIRAWLRSTLGQAAERSEGYQFIQAIDELCANIVEHADPTSGNSKSLAIQLNAEPDKLEAHITYAGDNFDLTAYLPRPMEEIMTRGHKGGLGIRLIQSLASSVQYKREGKLNICIIEKRLSA